VIEYNRGGVCRNTAGEGNVVANAQDVGRFVRVDRMG